MVLLNLMKLLTVITKSLLIFFFFPNLMFFPNKPSLWVIASKHVS